MFSANITSSFFSYQYKPLGLAANISESLLTWAGSISAISSTLMRISVGYLYDKFGLKRILFLIFSINTVVAFASYTATQLPYLYFCCIQLNYAGVGGIYALLPTPVVKTFGNKYGPQIYTIIMFGGTFAVVIDTLLVQFFFEKFGPYFIFIFCGVVSLIGLCLCMFFDPQLDIS